MNQNFWQLRDLGKALHCVQVGSFHSKARQSTGHYISHKFNGFKNCNTCGDKFYCSYDCYITFPCSLNNNWKVRLYHSSQIFNNTAVMNLQLVCGSRELHKATNMCNKSCSSAEKWLKRNSETYCAKPLTYFLRIGIEQWIFHPWITSLFERNCETISTFEINTKTSNPLWFSFAQHQFIISASSPLLPFLKMKWQICFVAEAAKLHAISFCFKLNLTRCRYVTLDLDSHNAKADGVRWRRIARPLRKIGSQPIHKNSSPKQIIYVVEADVR